MRRQGYSRAIVLDDNHGIEYRASIYKLNAEGTGAAMVYVPWYYGSLSQCTLYYTNGGREYHRVEFDSWVAAFNHVARSRRMLTGNHFGSSIEREAEAAGVELPGPSEPETDPWYHPSMRDDLDEVEDVMTMSKYDRMW